MTVEADLADLTIFLLTIRALAHGPVPSTPTGGGGGFYVGPRGHCGEREREE